jgi:D-alanine transaminase
MQSPESMKRTIYLNGEFLPLSEAKVSVLDRGFTFGDGVYEVIPVYAGNIFRLDEHLDRLANSLSGLDIRFNYSRDSLIGILGELVRKNPAPGDQQLYLQVTRGVTDRDHAYDNRVTPTFFAMCKPIIRRDLSGGVKAITHEDIRWKYCHIKSTALLASVLLKKLARDAGNCQEAILVRDGMVTEGASSNVFAVKDGIIKTPSQDNNVLPGITRDLLVELLRKDGHECRETYVSEAELRQADEVWITGSIIEVVPVISLDGAAIGTGGPGPYWRHASELFLAYKTHGPHAATVGMRELTF